MTSLESWLVNVSEGNHPQMAVFQISEIFFGFPFHGGTAKFHPFFFGIFLSKPSSYGGSAMTMEISIKHRDLSIKLRQVSQWFDFLALTTGESNWYRTTIRLTFLEGYSRLALFFWLVSILMFVGYLPEIKHGLPKHKLLFRWHSQLETSPASHVWWQKRVFFSSVNINSIPLLSY